MCSEERGCFQRKEGEFWGCAQERKGVWRKEGSFGGANTKVQKGVFIWEWSAKGFGGVIMK